MNRRSFLINSGITAAGTVIGGCAMGKDAVNSSSIGLQLYSLRDEIPANGLKGVLKKMAAAGYNSVEFFGFGTQENYFKNSPKEVAAMLKENKLASPSGHYQLDLFDKDGQQTIDAAKELGHEYIVIPWFPEEQRKSLDDYRSIAARINKAALLCEQSNIKMAYHNHDFEFIKYEGGVTGFDILMKDCDSSLVNFELDLFWVVTAGLDPVALFEQHPGRFKMWHVKDMDKSDTKKQTEVGSGSIDFKKIFSLSKLSGLEYFFVEQENLPVPSDANIRKSLVYVKEQLVPLLKK